MWSFRMTLKHCQHDLFLLLFTSIETGFSNARFNLKYEGLVSFSNV